MHSVIISGNSTGVGKTVVSAILTESLKGDYWKPIQAGSLAATDRNTVQKLVSDPEATFHPEIYTLSASLSPHHAARLEKVTLHSQKIRPPQTKRTLIIEGCGGVLCPLNETTHLGEVFCAWNVPWILVSKNYLGSINHTLLTHEFLRNAFQRVLGIIFNGIPNPDSERFILNYTSLPCLGRLYPEPYLNRRTIQCYAKKWRPSLLETVPSFGTHLPKHRSLKNLSCFPKEREPISSRRRESLISMELPRGG